MTLEEMWARLAQHQPFADRRGYGPEWARMCAERSEEAAVTAQRAAWVAWTVAAREAAADAVAAWAVAKDADEAVRWIERSEVQE